MKKKLLVSTIVVCLMGLSATAGAFAASKMNIKVNGKPTGIEPTMIGDKAYVPLRAVSELLGAQVDWEDATMTINITPPKAESVTDPKPTVDEPATPDAEPLPSPRDFTAALEVYNYISGLNQQMNSYHAGDRTKKEADDSFIWTKKEIQKPLAQLSMSYVPELQELVAATNTALKYFEVGITSASVLDNQAAKSGMEGVTKAYLKLQKAWPR